MYRTEGDRIFCDHEYICTISPPGREIDETRLEGESWIDMRDRTKPERERLEELGKVMAMCAATALNEEFTSRSICRDNYIRY